MKIIDLIIHSPKVWNYVQKFFGDNTQKMKLYRSVIVKPGKIMDFGCANGNTFPIFSDSKYYGCDIDENMINDAKEVYSKFRNAHFICCDINQHHFPTSEFDNILFALTGHHMDNRTLLKSFSSLSKLIKAGGTIHYFDSLNSPSKDHPITKALIKMDRGGHIRTIQEYANLRKQLDKILLINKQKIFQVTGAILPQPRYLYWEVVRRK